VQRQQQHGAGIINAAGETVARNETFTIQAEMLTHCGSKWTQ